MDSGALAATILGVLSLLITGYFSWRGVHSTTLADQERAAKSVQDQIKDARTEERATCDQRISTIQAQLNEITTDRNAQRDRADTLQAQINDRGLGPRR